MPIVYTVITNQKDQLQPVVPEPGYTYVVFTDRPINHPVWHSEQAQWQGQSDPRRLARRYKLLSHIYFPGEDTIWIDGRIRLNHPPSYYFRKYKSNIAIRPHHSRDCIYDEADEVRKLNFDDNYSITAHLNYIRSFSYPQHAGLNETGVLLRRYSDEVVRFNEAWWALLSAFSKRDQLSCNFVARKLGITIEQMARDEVTVGGHVRKTTLKT